MVISHTFFHNYIDHSHPVGWPDCSLNRRNFQRSRCYFRIGAYYTARQDVFGSFVAAELECQLGREGRMCSSVAYSGSPRSLLRIGLQTDADAPRFCDEFQSVLQVLGNVGSEDDPRTSHSDHDTEFQRLQKKTQSNTRDFELFRKNQSLNFWCSERVTGRAEYKICSNAEFKYVQVQVKGFCILRAENLELSDFILLKICSE